MKNVRLWFLASFTVILMMVPVVYAFYPEVHQQAPFSISVDPKKKTVKAGDDVTYTIEISADAEFSESIYITLEVEALSYHDTYDLGSQDPPFPKEFQYTVPIPEDVPGSITIHGTITGSSMEHTVSEEVQVNIKSGNIIGDIVGWFLGILSAISNWISKLFG